MSKDFESLRTKLVYHHLIDQTPESGERQTLSPEARFKDLSAQVGALAEHGPHQSFERHIPFTSVIKYNDGNVVGPRFRYKYATPISASHSPAELTHRGFNEHGELIAWIGVEWVEVPRPNGNPVAPSDKSIVVASAQISAADFVFGQLSAGEIDENLRVIEESLVIYVKHFPAQPNAN